MRISDTKELCDFVSTYATEFNHVNVTTAFLQVLKKPWGAPPKLLAQAIQTLVESAVQNMQDFGDQQIANTLQLAGGCKHTVGVCDDGNKAGGENDGAAEAVDGGDIRGVQLTVCCKHDVDVYDDGDKAREADDGTAGAAVGGDIRRVQLAGCCKHDVGVCDDGNKAGGENDGADGAAGGDDMRRVQLAGCCKHAVGVCDDGDKTGEADDGTAGSVGRGDIRGVQLAGGCKGEFNSQSVPNTLWAYVTMGTNPGDRMRWGQSRGSG